MIIAARRRDCISSRRRAKSFYRRNRPSAAELLIRHRDFRYSLLPTQSASEAPELSHNPSGHSPSYGPPKHGGSSITVAAIPTPSATKNSRAVTVAIAWLARPAVYNRRNWNEVEPRAEKHRHLISPIILTLLGPQMAHVAARIGSVVACTEQ